jgi:hypothetical protein
MALGWITSSAKSLTIFLIINCSLVSSKFIIYLP